MPAAGHALRDDAELVYRIEVREFIAGYTHRIGSDESHAKVVFSTAIPMAEFRDLSHRLPARHIYFAMASCDSGVEPPSPSAGGTSSRSSAARCLATLSWESGLGCFSFASG